MFSIPASQCLPLALAQKSSLMHRIVRDDEPETSKYLHPNFSHALVPFMRSGSNAFDSSAQNASAVPSQAILSGQPWLVVHNPKNRNASGVRR